jgi:hypothetical protein
VKGRVAGALTVTVTRNEILTALNKPDDFILAIGQVDGRAAEARLHPPALPARARIFVESINYKLQELLARGEDAGMSATLEELEAGSENPKGSGWSSRKPRQFSL